MTRKRRSKALFATGEHRVNRVWLWKRPESDAIYLGWYERGVDGSLRRRGLSLGKLTVVEAKKRAEALAQSLRAASKTLPPSEITLGALFGRYSEARTPHKSKSSQDHDHRAMGLFLRCWGEHRPVATLRPVDWDLFVRVRRSGDLTPAGGTGKAVRDRVLEQDLSLLRAILTWAVHNEFLDREPMAGCKIPRERNVNRPLLFEEEFDAMLAVADAVHERCRLALLLAHETGHRSKSIRMLRWTDVDIEDGRIRWRAENDKTRNEHVVPISGRLRVELAIAAVPDEIWLVPSERLEGSPVGRETFEAWWRSMEKLAGIERKQGRGWHALRRKFATERKHGSLTDLAYAGGWIGTQTLTKVYMQPDAESIRRAVTDRVPLRGHEVFAEAGLGTHQAQA